MSPATLLTKGCVLQGGVGRWTIGGGVLGRDKQDAGRAAEESLPAAKAVQGLAGGKDGIGIISDKVIRVLQHPCMSLVNSKAYLGATHCRSQNPPCSL